jgi:hypothetical protein
LCFGPDIPGNEMRLLILLILVAGTTISTWIIGIQMRRRIKRDLGRKATASDLTSLETWMKVDEEEEKKQNDTDKMITPN